MKHAIPTDWDGQFCRFAICWPDSPTWRALLRGLVTEPARGYFWDERTGYIKGVLADFRQTMDQNLELPEVIMACNDNGIAEALQAVAQAIVTASANASSSANASANACCEQTIINQGGGSVGVVTQPSTGQPIPIYGTQPPIVLPPGTYPEGYTSQEEYELDKCQLANLITDDFIDSLRRIGAITTFNTIALAGLLVAAVVGAIIFPPAAIPVAVAALIAISGATGVLAGLVLGLEERREDVVCALYEGDTVDSIIATLADILDEIIENIPVLGFAGNALKTLALVLMNSDTLNQMFKKQAHADYPNADCSGCFCQFQLYSYNTFGANGSIVEHDTVNQTITFATAPTTHTVSQHRFDFAFQDSEDQADPPAVFCAQYVRFVSQTGITDLGDPQIYVIAAPAGQSGYSDDPPWTGWILCQSVSVRSATPGTVTIEYARDIPAP